MKKTITSFLSLLLVLVLVSAFALPASAESYAPGYWETVKVGGWTLSAWVLDNPVKKCSSFRIDYEATPHAGARVKNWNVWAGYGSSFTKVGSLYLPEGSGSVEATIRINPAMNVDRIAVTPGISGNYTFDYSMGIYDLVGSSSSSSSSSSSYSNSSSGSGLSGFYKSVKLPNRFNSGAWMLDTPLKKVREITVDIDVQMNNSCYCYNWQVWKVTGNDSFTKIGTIYLPSGNGSGSTTIRFQNGQSIDGIVISPIASGGFTWEHEITVRDPKY